MTREVDVAIIGAGTAGLTAQEIVSQKTDNYVIIDTDQFFELEELPGKMAVFGLGPIGIELGQALHRLGVDIIAFGRRKTAGGLTDPDLQAYAFEHFSKEMNIQLGEAQILKQTDDPGPDFVTDMDGLPPAGSLNN